MGALAIAGPGVLLQTACGDTKQLVRWTLMLIGALKDVSPILADMGASQIVSLVGKAIPIAESLKKAFENNDHATTLTLIENLINPQTGIITEIANQVGLLADDARKKLVLGLLAIGMVALRLISANIEQDVPVAAADSVRKARPAAASAITRGASKDKLEAAFNAVRF